MTRTRWAAAGGATLIVLSGQAGHASSDPQIQSISSTTLLRHSIPVTGPKAVKVKLIKLPRLALAGGTSRYLSANYVARNTSTARFILQGAEIQCARGSAVSRSVYTTTNALKDRVARTVAVRWMFRVPESGNYDCALWGFAATQYTGDRKLDILRGGLGMAGTTSPDGAEWRHPTTETLADGRSLYILRRTWTARSGASRIGVNADVELTHHGSSAQSSSASVKLYVTQIDARGKACRTPYTENKPIRLDHARNHDKVYFTARGLSVSTAAGCTRRFIIKARVTSTGPNAIDINGGEKYTYTNAIAFSY